MAFSATYIIEEEKKVGEENYPPPSRAVSLRDIAAPSSSPSLPKGEKHELSFKTSSDTEKRNEPRVP